MTLDELYKPIKDAKDNGLGDLNVFVKEFGKSSEQTMNPVEFVNIVSSYSNGEKESFIEIVYKNYSKDKQEDITKFNDIQIQSYRDERRLIFDAWRKQNEGSIKMIKDMLNLMKHKMKPCNTERCQSEFDNICHRAEAYIEELCLNIPPYTFDKTYSSKKG